MADVLDGGYLYIKIFQLIITFLYNKFILKVFCVKILHIITKLGHIDGNS